MTKFTEKNGRTCVEIAIPTDTPNEAVLMKASWNTEHLNSVQHGDLKISVDTGILPSDEGGAEEDEHWHYNYSITGADESRSIHGSGFNENHECAHGMEVEGGNWKDVMCDFEVSIIPANEATPEQLDYELQTDVRFECSCWS